MAAGTLFPSPWFTALDADANPLSGALANFYVAGTSTPAITYADVALTTPNSNPVIADGAGRVGPIFLTPGQSYKLVLTDANSVVIRTQDNIQGVPTSSNNIDITGTAGQSLSAGTVAYLSDGSGGKTAGQWYPADIANGYSSALNIIAMVPAAVSSGASGTFRVGGQVTGLASLTVGTTYYVGTAGAITASPQLNRRPIGEADSTSSLVLFQQSSPNSAQLDLGLCEFRLTLTTGTPITTADVVAATTIFCTPYQGNRLALYDGNGVPTIFAPPEFSIAVPATTSQNYDIFAFNNAGTPALELLAWASGSARATPLVNTIAPGIYTKSGDPTRRYLGSFRTTTVSGQTEDSFANRLLSNGNSLKRPLRIVESTNSWPYSIATYRQANANAANQVAVVVGLAGVFLELDLVATATGSSTGNMFVAIGEDSTISAASGQLMTFGTGTTSTTAANPRATLRRYPTIGYHTYAWLEQAQAIGVTTWFGNAGGVIVQSGLHGTIDG